MTSRDVVNLTDNNKRDSYYRAIKLTLTRTIISSVCGLPAPRFMDATTEFTDTVR